MSSVEIEQQIIALTTGVEVLQNNGTKIL